MTSLQNKLNFDKLKTAFLMKLRFKFSNFTTFNLMSRVRMISNAPFSLELFSFLLFSLQSPKFTSSINALPGNKKRKLGACCWRFNYYYYWERALKNLKFAFRNKELSMKELEMVSCTSKGIARKIFFFYLKNQIYFVA